jgi:hypothetical protein
MSDTEFTFARSLARAVGWALIGSIIFGVVIALTLSSGIDVNMTADIAGTAEAMLNAEMRLRAKAYLTLLTLIIQVFITIGFYVLLRKQGQVLALWSLFIGIASCFMVVMGAVFTMNAALVVGSSSFSEVVTSDQRVLITALQAASDYTSFHLALIIGCVSNAGFFYLFFKSNYIPKVIAAWGVFASLFVASMISLRDFIPALGHDLITATFMLSNLIALVSLGLYLGIKGIRRDADKI